MYVIPVLRRSKLKNPKYILLGSIVLAVLIIGGGYLFMPRAFPQIARIPAAQGSIIVSLSTPTKASDGITYSGVVAYNTGTGAYTYAISPDSHVVNTVGTTAFSDGSRVLGLHSGASSTEIVVYNTETFSTDKVVERTNTPPTIFSAVWSPDSNSYAYLRSGSTTPVLVVGSIDSESAPREFSFMTPIGFSSDGQKIIVSGLSRFEILDIASGKRTPLASLPGQTNMTWVTSNGNYLIQQNGTNLSWYAIDWNAAKLTLGTIVPIREDSDIALASKGRLLIHNPGDGFAVLYASVPERGVLPVGTIPLALPDDARILYAHMP